MKNCANTSLFRLTALHTFCLVFHYDFLELCNEINRYQMQCCVDSGSSEAKGGDAK